MRWRVGCWLLAGLAVAVPPAGTFVEARYSNGLFPYLQRALTTASNRVPLALFDVLLIAFTVAVIVLVAIDLRGPRRGWLRATIAVLSRVATLGAGAYLMFLLLWGLNYRRVPITARVPFDASRITPENARRLAAETVRRVNALYAAAHREASPPSDEVDPTLARAFAEAQQSIGGAARVVAGRPKRTLLDGYFRRAGVAGMTDPYFLETLVASDLLTVERPMVIAHEWSHLAGIADEGEANYLGWLTCRRGSPLHQYSGWLSLYSEVTAGLKPADARRVSGTLGEGPRADLNAIRDRLMKNLNPIVAAAGWRIYDQYLKANHIDQGTQSYAEVVRLVLGTGWDAPVNASMTSDNQMIR